ncbi:hypothetical protein M8C21_029441, partial [Ambrosia artemisiifolia]
SRTCDKRQLVNKMIGSFNRSATLYPRHVNKKRGPADSENLESLEPSQSIGVLHEILQRCSSKVEYRSVFSYDKG